MRRKRRKSMASTATSAEQVPTGLLIDGEERGSGSGETIENINPATEEVLANVSCASGDDVDLAVRGARVAFETWRRTPGQERGRLLHRLASLIERDAEKFHLIKALENGTPAGGPDVPMAIDLFRYYAG